MGLLLGSRDFVINGEYWMKSCLIARMECQEMPLMGSLPAWHRETGQDCMVTKQHIEEIINIHTNIVQNQLGLSFAKLV